MAQQLRRCSTRKSILIVIAATVTCSLAFLFVFTPNLRVNQHGSMRSSDEQRHCVSSPRCSLGPRTSRPIPTNCSDEAGINDRESFCNPRASDDPPFDALVSECTSNTGPNGIRRGTILFLVQGEGAPSSFWDAVSERQDTSILWLSWKDAVPEDQKKSTYADYVFYPNSSFNRGRNRLLRRGLELELNQAWMFEYYVFMDEDQNDMEFSEPQYEELVSDLFTGKERCPPTIALLAHLLLKYRPSRAGIQVINYKGDVEVSTMGCMSTSSLDGNVDAFHRTALVAMMPYTSKYDEVNIWMGSSVMNAKSDVLLGSYSVKFNQLVTFPYAGKQKHADYAASDYVSHRHSMYCFINYCMSAEARRGRFLYPTEDAWRLDLRIRVSDSDDSAPCPHMSSSIDYSSLLDAEFLEKNWFA